MRIGIAVLLVFLGAVMAQGSEETKTSERTPGQIIRQPVTTDRMWSFHFEGKKRKGEFLELAQPDAQRQNEGRTLIITHLEVRMRQTMRTSVVEYQKTRVRGKDGWKKKLRRSELFSIGYLDGTTKYARSEYKSDVGMKFGPDTRPSLQITQGGGDMAVYAEGYWAD